MIEQIKGDLQQILASVVIIAVCLVAIWGLLVINDSYVDYLHTKCYPITVEYSDCINITERIDQNVLVADNGTMYQVPKTIYYKTPPGFAYEIEYTYNLSVLDASLRTLSYKISDPTITDFRRCVR